jgi:hypothetical protein
VKDRDCPGEISMDKPTKQDTLAELMANWRASDRDLKAAETALTVAEQALESAHAAEEAARAASKTVDRALAAAKKASASANQAAEAAKLFLAAARQDETRAQGEVDQASQREAASGELFRNAQAEKFQKVR